MYFLDVSYKLQKELAKLVKKSPKQARIITKKMRAILENPYHFKPLRGDLHGSRRVHIDKSFVLTYEVDEKTKMVRFLDYAHHDNIY